MDSQPTFADLLNQHVAQDGRYARQLSAATEQRFGAGQGIAHSSLSRWLRGAAQKPRSWVDIVKLGAVLQLSQNDLHQLLHAAGHDVPHILATEPPIPGLFDPWLQPEVGLLPPFQAPPKTVGFIGQTGLLVGLERYFGSQGQSRVCCLLGMAGLGKTSLATQLAYQLKDQFSDGVLWLNLAQSADPLAAQQAIAQAYGQDFTPFADVGSRSSKLRELLAHKNALLVLDDAQSDAQLRPLLPPDGPCAVLITSRRHDLALASAAYRLTLSPLNAAKAEGMALFRQLLPKEQVRAEPEPLQALADWLGLQPLALTIAAQRLRHEPGWTAEKFLARLQQAKRPLDLLIWGDQSVRDSLATSALVLPPATQQLLALLGHFASSFVPEHVAAVAERPLPDVEDQLRQIYNQSLLTINRQDRYELHPLVRHYCRELPQQPDWPHRFVAHFTSLAAQPTAAAEQPHIVAALELAQQLKLDEALVTSVTDFIPHLQRTGQHALADRWLRQAEQTARRQNNSSALTRILHQSGFTAMKQGTPDKADSYYQEALSLAQSLGDVGQTAEILHKLSALAYRRGRYEETEQFCQEALVLARQVQNQHLVASLLTNLGLVEGVNGRFKEAIVHYEEALALARQGDDKGLVINILQNLGLVHEQRGNYAQAKEPYEEGLKLAEALKDPELRSRMLGNLGAVACHLGNYAEATGYFQQGLALAEKNDLLIQQYRQQANLGEAAMLRGQFREANAHYRQALALVRTREFPEDLGIILNQAGENFLRQDAYPEAEYSFREALHLAEEHGFRQVGPLSLFGLARLAGIRKDFVEARALGEQSRQQLAAIGHRKAQEVYWWLQELPPAAAPEASKN
ncbi:MAG: tetratricopeptide repeat protein [Anaerolineales bacterium]|nr:tetratricopeptide repeat protein [Anaerolineales bacterium]MCB8937000.1 tetratricopeptide repeat protein [Ardenticatenaceae bacterium]